MNYKKQRKKKYIFITLIIAILLGVTTVFWAQMSDEGQGYRTISVVDVSGQVSVVKDGIEYNAYPGMLLQEGQEVVTSGDSYVRMVLDDDKYIKLESGSRAVFDTLGLLGSGKTQINLERGSLTSELVNPLGTEDSYVVNTPNAVLAVRGTFFRVDLSIQKNGEVMADVMTYGGQVASKRIQPTGEVVDEEVLIDAGYKATINMTTEETHYVVETGDILPTQPITIEDIPDEDLVDVYFAAENGHELFVTAEDAKVDLKKRDIKIEEYKSVYEIAEEVKKEQEEATKPAAGVSNTTSALVKADDSQPIVKRDNFTNVGETMKQEVALKEETVKQEEVVELEEALEQEEASEQTGTSVQVENTEQEETLEQEEISEPEEETTPPEETHVHKEITTTTDATCTTAGAVVVTCSDCNETLSVTEIPVKGHTEVVGGAQDTHSKCSICGIKISDSHKMVNTAYVAPSCTTDGSSTYACDCGYSYVEAVAALGHNRVIEYTDGTSTSEGKKSDICNNCDTVYAEETLLSIPLHFPDSIFGQYVSTVFDKDGHASLNTEELAVLQSVLEIPLGGPVDGDGGVTNLKGIEYFASLTTLDCSYNPSLTALDLSKNTQLTSLNIAFTNMKNLNVANTQLTSLNLGAFSALETLDVTNTPLTDLQVASESIKTLNLSTNEELLTLDVCGCHQLESLDLTSCESLTGFRCSNTQIPLLDFSQCSNLNSLMLVDNLSLTELRLSGCDKLSSLAISSNTNLKSLDVSAMAITTLDTSELLNLEVVDISNSSITALNLMNNEKLTELITANAELTILHINSPYVNDLDLSTNLELKELNLNNCTALTNVDLSENDALTTFTCGNSGLVEIDLSEKTNLSTLTVIGCSELTSINITNCSGLSSPQLITLSKVTSIHANGSGLTGLVTIMLPALQELYVNNTSISDLDVSSNPELINLSVSGTDIAALDLNNNNNLITLKMDDTKLETLKVSSDKLTGNALNVAGAGSYLKELWITDCTNMTGLVLESNTELTSFHCTNSGLSTIDLINNSKLVEVDVSNSSRLSSLLNLNNKSNLKTVNVSGTRLYTLDLQYTSSLTSLTLNTSLSELFCMGCTALAELDVSGCSQLTKLYLTDTSSLSTLDLSGNTALQILYVDGTSAISSLDVSTNENLTAIYTGGRYAAGEIDFIGLDDMSIINDETN